MKGTMHTNVGNKLKVKLSEIENDNTQYGLVVVFKKTSSKHDILNALNNLSCVIDRKYYHDDIIEVESFNPKWGSPVWYIP